MKDVFTATAENGSSDTALAKTTNANVYRPDLLISGGGSFVETISTIPAAATSPLCRRCRGDGRYIRPSSRMTAMTFVITAPAAPPVGT